MSDCPFCERINNREDVYATTEFAAAFPDADAYELTPKEMHQGVLAARSAFHDDLMKRFVTDLYPEFKRKYAIARGGRSVKEQQSSERHAVPTLDPGHCMKR